MGNNGICSGLQSSLLTIDLFRACVRRRVLPGCVGNLQRRSVTGYATRPVCLWRVALTQRQGKGPNRTATVSMLVRRWGAVQACLGTETVMLRATMRSVGGIGEIAGIVPKGVKGIQAFKDTWGMDTAMSPVTMQSVRLTEETVEVVQAGVSPR